MLNSLLVKYERLQPFSPDEAWGLFRLAAIGEAFGWTMLISGIVISRYITPGNDIAVQFAGHMHGILFLIYITAVIGLYPSLNWTRRRTIIAGLASVPPYGSLLFEQWAAYQRRRLRFRQNTMLVGYTLLRANTESSENLNDLEPQLVETA